MNNKIVYVTKNEAQLIKADAVQNREIYFAEIDGAEIKAEEDYVRAMAEAFAFPHKLNRRTNLKVHHVRLKNQLHEQVCIAYPSYKQFFQDIGRPTALYFWEHYPSPRLLQGKTVEELAEELIPISHNQFSIRKCQKILDAVKADGDTTRDYQS